MSLLTGYLQFLPADSKIVRMARDLFYRGENRLAGDVNGVPLAGDCLKSLFRELLDIMQSCEDGIRRNTDPDYLHDFRVAARKSRSLLLMVRNVFPKKIVDRYGAGLAWLLKATTSTRDMHVYLEKLPRYLQCLPADKASALEPFRDFLEKNMIQEHQSLLVMLDSKRYRNLMKSWQTFLDEPVANNARMPNARRPVKEVADKALKRTFRKLLKCGERLRTTGEVSALHKLRISCKKFRYLLALFKPLYREEKVTPVINLLKHVQETLGDYHDHQVEIDIIRAYELQTGNQNSLPGYAVEANIALIDYLTQQQQKKYEQFQQIYMELGSKQNRARIKSMLKV
jgi:CHAD domain-containing protein